MSLFVCRFACGLLTVRQVKPPLLLSSKATGKHCRQVGLAFRRRMMLWYQVDLYVLRV